MDRLGFPPGAQPPEVIMTSTALDRRPAGVDSEPFPGPSAEGADLGLPPPWSRADLLSRDDSELLELVKSEPIGSAARSAACEIVVKRYEALVRSCVLRYRDSPESVEELMQVGYVGLLKAINNFDPAFGGALAAYAQPCISGEIKRHFRDKRWQVRVKRSAQELLLEMRKAAGDLAQDLGHAPSDAELARHLGVTDQELQEARQADMFFHTSSLDAPLTQADGPARLADLLGADDPELERALDMDAVGAHWNELPSRERRILLMRFYGNLTQAEIGERLGVSQMHVSRLQATALRYLRECLLGRETDDDSPPAPVAYR
jgi:RNA polymerase sigma-B factor